MKKARYCLAALMAGYFIFGGPALNESFGQQGPTIGTIDRSQEMIREDDTLRQKIEQPERFFVKKIVLKSDLKLPAPEVEALTARYEGQWLTEGDVLELIDSFKTVIEKADIAAASRVNASYELKNDKTLEITLSEQKF